MAALQNKAGQFVLPTPAAVETTVEEGGTVDPKTNLITFDFNKITGAGHVPDPDGRVPGGSHDRSEHAKAKALSTFVKYILK